MADEVVQALETAAVDAVQESEVAVDVVAEDAAKVVEDKVIDPAKEEVNAGIEIVEHTGEAEVHTLDADGKKTLADEFAKLKAHLESIEQHLKTFGVFGTHAIWDDLKAAKALVVSKL